MRTSAEASSFGGGRRPPGRLARDEAEAVDAEAGAAQLVDARSPCRRRGRTRRSAHRVTAAPGRPAATLAAPTASGTGAGVGGAALARVDQVAELGRTLAEGEHRVAGGSVAVGARRHDERRLAGVVDVLLPRVVTFGRVRLEDGGSASPFMTEASFHTRVSASSMPELRPRTPKIGTRCAASPAKSTRPCVKSSQGQGMGLVEAVPLQGPRAVVAQPVEVAGDAVADAILLGLRLGVVDASSW